jgi:hypothetical protein
MTRAYGSHHSRRTQKRIPFVPRPRDPSIHRLGFTCFQLVVIVDRDPGEPPYVPIEVRETRNTMGAFTTLPCDRM